MKDLLFDAGFFKSANVGNNHFFVEGEYTPKLWRIRFDFEVGIDYGASVWLALSLGPFSGSVLVRRPIIPLPRG